MNVLFLRLLIRVLYVLNARASEGLDGGGRPAFKGRKMSLYRRHIKALVSFENFVLTRTERLAPSEMQKIQCAKIKRILVAASRAPYWRKQLGPSSEFFRSLESMEELRRFPIVLRMDVQEHFPTRKMLDASAPRRRLVVARTSGSTGEPLAFFLDTRIVVGRRARYHRMVRWLFPSGTPVVVRAFPGRHLFGFFRKFENIFFFSMRGAHGFATPLSRLLNFLHVIQRRFHGPLVMDMFPSNIMRLVPMLAGSRLDTSRILGFVCGGEALLPGEREYVRTTLGCDIRSYYASTEFEIIGQECGQSPEHAFHVNAEYFYVEIVDEKGNPLPRNETGRVIITSLEHEAQPFIRYDTGDLGHLLAQPCSCGRTLPLLVVEGRQANLIRLPNGRSFTQFNVIGHFYNPEVVSQIRQFQVVHERPDVFTIKLVPQSTTVEQQERAIEILKARLLETFGEDTHVSFEIIDSIPVTERGKSIGYVSKF